MDVLEKLIDLLDDWLIAQCTDEHLRFALIDYARGRSGVTMQECVRGRNAALTESDRG